MLGPSPDVSSISIHDAIPASLQHLNLTGHIRIGKLIKVGGHGDVYDGYLRRGIELGGNELRVAVKQLRLYLRGSNDIKKASIIGFARRFFHQYSFLHSNSTFVKS